MPTKKKDVGELLENFTFDPLPKGFVIAKPIQWGEYDEEETYALDKQGRLIKERKHNGWKLLPTKANNKWKIYTDGIRDVTAHLPQIVEELNQLKVSNNSMLVGEGIADIKTSDNAKVGKILNTKDINLALQKQKEFGEMRLVIFNIAFGDGECLLQKPYSELITAVQVLIGSKLKYVMPVEVLYTSLDEAKKMVLKEKMEGLVLYNTEFRSSFRLDGGNPERPDGCYKWKPMFEGDFFAREWIPSEKDPKVLHEIVLLQIDPKTGKEVNWGKHGTFSKKDREEIHSLLLKKQPVVVQFEYETRTENNKITNKRFMGIRHDKKWQDCLIPLKIFPKNMKPLAR